MRHKHYRRAELRGILSVSLVLAIGVIPQVRAADLDEAKAAFGKKDYPRAIALFKSAATRGVAEAQAMLGTMYFDGLGVRYDHQEAFKWNLMAAKQGRPEAEYRLALAYSTPASTVGRSPVPPWDRDEANHWFQKALEDALKGAERGDPISQDTLGELYYFRVGRSHQDNADAFSWLLKAAEQEVPDAQYRLGMLYEGSGIATDLSQARSWYLKAAVSDHAGAQDRLALMLKNAGDMEGSKKWFMKSAALGSDTAVIFLKQDFGITIKDDGMISKD